MDSAGFYIKGQGENDISVVCIYGIVEEHSPNSDTVISEHSPTHS